MPNRIERTLVLVLFFVSGACGLVYEVVWARELSVILGVTTFATSTVLAAYMAGLALGSVLIGPRVDRVRNPVRLYAWLEVGIGLLALCVPAGLWIAQQAFAALGGALSEHFFALNLLRSLTALLVLLLPTTLMGGTVPAIGRYLIERSDTVGWNVGVLYALNTFGAVIGVVATGFVLIPELGLSGATTIAIVGNLAIGALLLVLRVGEPQDEAAAEGASSADATASTPAWDAELALAVAVFALSGFAALAYEVLWTRVLVVHLHNTSYAFSTMLAVFLAGLVIGDALMMRFYDRITHPLWWLGVVQVGVGLAVVVAVSSYGPLAELSMRLLGNPTLDGFDVSVSLMFVRAGLVLLPVSTLLGTTFPLVARIACRDEDGIGRDLGRIYAFNTGGSILGSLAASFVMIPVLGVRGSMVFLACTNAVLGTLCLVRAARPLPWRIAGGVAGLSAVALLPLAVPESLFQAPFSKGAGRMLYYREGVTDTTAVREFPNGDRIVVYGDLRGTAGTATNNANRMQGHLAHLLHPSPRRSLQIGFGVGNTLASAALHPEVEKLECAELSPHVRETSRFFPTNAGVLDEAKVELIVEDGRNHLLRTSEPYEVITLEPPNAFTAGVVSLYTREFYELAASRLTEDGLLVQWIAAVDHDHEDIRRMVHAVAAAFPEVSLWDHGPLDPLGFNSPSGFLLVVGHKRPMSLELAELERRMARSPVADDLADIELPKPAQLLARFVAGDRVVRRWVGDIPPVTDDRTVVDYRSARSLGSGFGMGFGKLLGEQARAWQLRLHGIGVLINELREPIAPWVDAPEPAKQRLAREVEREHRVFRARVAKQGRALRAG